jgi:integrase
VAVSGTIGAENGAELDIGWQLQRVRRELLHRETKTEASDATLPLPGICVTALRLREKEQAEARVAAGETWTETALVFTTSVGTPFEPQLQPPLRDPAREGGLRKITVHDVRRTCASLLAVLDVHPPVAMRIMRHAQIDVTMNVYTEVSDAKTLQALKRLAKQLDT